MMFVGALLLVESLFSAFIIFVLSIKYPNDAGDATSLKQLTHLSARFWGFLFFAQAVYVAYLIFQLIY